MPLFLRRPAHKGSWEVAALALPFPPKPRFYIKEVGIRRNQYFSAIACKLINSEMVFCRDKRSLALEGYVKKRASGNIGEALAGWLRQPFTGEENKSRHCGCRSVRMKMESVKPGVLEATVEPGLFLRLNRWRALHRESSSQCFAESLHERKLPCSTPHRIGETPGESPWRLLAPTCSGAEREGRL